MGIHARLLSHSIDLIDVVDCIIGRIEEASVFTDIHAMLTLNTLSFSLVSEEIVRRLESHCFLSAEVGRCVSPLSTKPLTLSRVSRTVIHWAMITCPLAVAARLSLISTTQRIRPGPSGQ